MSVAAMVDNEIAKAHGDEPPTVKRRRLRPGHEQDHRRAEGDLAEDTPAAKVGAGEKGAAQQRVKERQQATGPGDAISALVSYVPAEAIAAYLVMLPFMDPSDKGYSGRWLLALGVVVLTVVYAAGYRKIAAVKADQPFHFPWLPVIVSVASFAAWVFAIPDSPFNDFGFYTPALGGAAGTVAASLVAFIGSVTGEILTYAAADNTEATTED